MKESVSAVFVTNDLVYFIKRQNYLSVFPGYFAVPGGKIDEADSVGCGGVAVPDNKISKHILKALFREVKEELNFDLENAINNNFVLSIDHIGTAITPEFNPYRFKNYYIKITLNEVVDFDVDHSEINFGEWNTAQYFLKKYENGKMLAVPPAILLLRALEKDINLKLPLDLSLPYDPQIEVPMIESLYGIRQFLPLSNTFPPANRTNSFIIGDDGAIKILIDPSPKNENELEKFLRSVDKIGFDKIMLTHHHPDHYEFSNLIAKKYNVPMMMSQDTYKRIGANYFRGIDVEFLKEGDFVTKSLGRDIYIYQVPGHDEGQLALAPKSMDWFLVGDLIQTIGTVAILPPEGCMKSYFESLQRVINLNPQNIIPSHGIILGGINKVSETLIHRQSREEQIIKLMGQNIEIEDMINIIYPDLESRLTKYARKTIEAHIIKIKNNN
jgi:glyoxylase-like metal-dependent hydrolase (beta-lactamase superfamily II)/8-oxo-dGTP pyrophosphatase MutT (NUDIX family)